MIIFDYATLADDSHRRHFIEPTCCECKQSLGDEIKFDLGWHCHYPCDNVTLDWLPDYAAYYAAAKDDKPIDGTRDILYRFLEGDYRKEIQIWVDLPKICLRTLIDWLDINIDKNKYWEKRVKMRQEGDTTPWHELKEKWVLESCKKNDTFYAINTIFEMAFERAGSPMIETWKKYRVPVMEVHI